MTSVAEGTIPSSSLADFTEISAPSENEWRNRNTFAYKLSELIFGSLLASYVLGFIGFATVHVQRPTSFILVPTTNQELVAKATDEGVIQIAKLSRFTLNDIAQLFSVVTADQGLQVNLLLRSLSTFGFLMVLQTLSISILFSIFTALLYVNFHQSILYLSLDQRKAAYDFIIAISIGICFGLSMIFPMSVMFWIGCLTLLVFIRKRALLREYGEHVCIEVARAGGWTVPSQSPSHHRQIDEIVAIILPKVNAALLACTTNAVVRSWGRVGRWYMWLGIAIVILVPLGVFFGDLASGGTYMRTESELRWLVAGNVILCSAVACFLLRFLLKATSIMPSKADEENSEIDRVLNGILKPIKENLGAKP
jgi:hypothetical protein